jgi:predicted transcriptional regulator
MSPPDLSDAEWKVMNAVWRRRAGATARQVLESVAAETGWAYSTVKTLLERLVEKGALEASFAGRAARYRPRLARRRALRAAARSLMGRAFGGAAGPLVHFLLRSEKLTAEERDELRRMLDEQGRGEAER